MLFICFSHEAAEIAGVTAFSIGEEEVDRRIIIYKKDHVPDEDELNALKRGEEWTPEKARLLAEQVRRCLIQQLSEVSRYLVNCLVFCQTLERDGEKTR